MAIIKVKKYDSPFVQIDKRPINDETLTWKAKGMLAYLLSKPDDWTVRVADLVKRSKDGRDAVLSGLKELEAAGYIVRFQEHKPDGTFGPVIYEVYELPQRDPPIPEPEKPAAVGSAPQPENPEPVNPDPEKPTHSNNESNNNDGNNIEKDGNATAFPHRFPDWLEQISQAKNKTGALMDFYGWLFPAREAPDPGHMGKLSKTVGGAGRLAEMLWKVSARPPKGDILKYIHGAWNKSRRDRGRVTAVTPAAKQPAGMVSGSGPASIDDGPDADPLGDLWAGILEIAETVIPRATVQAQIARLWPMDYGEGILTLTGPGDAVAWTEARLADKLLLAAGSLPGAHVERLEFVPGPADGSVG